MQHHLLIQPHSTNNTKWTNKKREQLFKRSISVKLASTPVAKNGLISGAESHNNGYISTYYCHSQITLAFLYVVVFRIYSKDDSDFVCDFCGKKIHESKLTNQKRHSTQISLLYNDSQKLKLDLILEKGCEGVFMTVFWNSKQYKLLLSWQDLDWNLWIWY